MRRKQFAKMCRRLFSARSRRPTKGREHSRRSAWRRTHNSEGLDQPRADRVPRGDEQSPLSSLCAGPVGAWSRAVKVIVPVVDVFLTIFNVKLVTTTAARLRCDRDGPPQVMILATANKDEVFIASAA